MEALLILIAQGIGVIVSTIMSTEIFKRLFTRSDGTPIISARAVTFVVWVVIGLIVYFVLNWFPGPVTILLVVAASGLYSWGIEPMIKSSRRREPPAPIGGGGSGPLP